MLNTSHAHRIVIIVIFGKKNYHVFFPEAIIPQTKVSGACNFEDDCIMMDELKGDEE